MGIINNLSASGILAESGFQIRRCNGTFHGISHIFSSQLVAAVEIDIISQSVGISHTIVRNFPACSHVGNHVPVIIEIGDRGEDQVAQHLVVCSVGLHGAQGGHIAVHRNGNAVLRAGLAAGVAAVVALGAATCKNSCRHDNRHEQRC